MNRTELEQERAYLSTPGYFGFAEQKDYALTKLLERNRQLDAVLAYMEGASWSDFNGKWVESVISVDGLRDAIESA